MTEACECEGEQALRDDKELEKKSLFFSIIKAFYIHTMFAEIIMHIIKCIEETYHYAK